MNLRPLVLALSLPRCRSQPRPTLPAERVQKRPVQAGSQLQMAMTLYAGGVTLGKVDLNATIRGDQYHAVSNLQTGGVVNAFWQSEIQATSTGTVAPKSVSSVAIRFVLHRPLGQEAGSVAHL